MFPSVIFDDANSFALSFVVRFLSPTAELVKRWPPLRADVIRVFMSSFSVAGNANVSDTDYGRCTSSMSTVGVDADGNVVFIV